MDFLNNNSLAAKKLKRDLEHELVPKLNNELGEVALDMNRRGLLGGNSVAERDIYRTTKRFGDEVIQKAIAYFMEHNTTTADLPEIMNFLTSAIDYAAFILKNKFSRPPYDSWSAPLEGVIGGLRKRAKDEAEILLADSTSMSIEITLGDCQVAIGVLDFMNVSELKAIVERDLSELQKAIKSNCIKTVLILSGSVIEGLLLDALIARRAEAEALHTGKKLESWTLDKMITVAEQLGILPYKTLEKFTDGIREYRNLVHPGREIRESIRVAPEEARIAVEIVNIILRTFRG